MSIRNSPPIGWRHRSFLRNQIIHHSQTRITLFGTLQFSIRFSSFSNWATSQIWHTDVWVPYVFTSFSNSAVYPLCHLLQFEYHTFLHHSQTICFVIFFIASLSTIRFYIILKHTRREKTTWTVWVPYVFTSFSNNMTIINDHFCVWVPYVFTSFSNYKLGIVPHDWVWVPYVFTSFSNLLCAVQSRKIVWVPYVFTSFSNESGYGSTDLAVWVPYVFTSFSNARGGRLRQVIVWVPYVFTSFSN